MQLPNIMDIAYTLVQNNERVRNSPQGQQFMQILQNGDVQAGQNMAMNICNSYGQPPANMLMQAIQFIKNQRNM